MQPIYRIFTEKDLDLVVRFYLSYYNSCGGRWTYEKAQKRIHQITTMEDALAVLQWEDETLIGFLMGYYKTFDDTTGFFLEEILIASNFQNKGYGSAFLQQLKSILTAQHCAWIELLTTTDSQHENFYRKNSYTKSDHLTLHFLDL